MDYVDRVVKESEIKGIAVKRKKTKKWFLAREKPHVANYNRGCQYQTRREV